MASDDPPRVRLLSADGPIDCPLDALGSTLARISKAPAGRVWLHSDLHPEIFDSLEAGLMHELALKNMRGGIERPRVEEYTDHLYLSLFFARESPGVTETRLEDLRVFLGPHWLLSLGDLTDQDYAHLCARMDRMVFRPSRGPGQMLYVLADWAVESLNPLLDAIDERVDDLENQVVVKPEQSVVQQLFQIKRRMVDLRRQVVPLRDVMQRLASQGLSFIEPESEVYFRDVHDDVLRAVEKLDSQREILASALDLYQSSIANRLNKVMKRLTLVATLFMPITFITGFFGMNFDMLPFGSMAWFGVMLASLACSVALMLIFYGRSFWD